MPKEAKPLRVMNVTLLYTWGAGRATSGRVDVTAWACCSDVMGWKWAASGEHDHVLAANTFKHT